MECDLIARVVKDGRIISLLYEPAAMSFIPDDGSNPLSDAELRALAANSGREVTYTAAPPGSGTRLTSF